MPTIDVPPKRPASPEQAFTLVELVILLAVVGVIAIGSFSLRNTQPEERRFSDNQYRLQRVREASIGSLEAQLEEDELISGFVADVGRLPNTLSELLSQGDLPSWNYHTNAEIWAGWRGPYLFTFTTTGGFPAFFDGWQATGDTNNFGWLFEPDQNAGTLRLQSYGRDGLPGGTRYDLDYPPDQLVIYPSEALINIANWEITVYLFNPLDPDTPGPALPATAQSYRVRLHYPQEGRLDWPDNWPATGGTRDEAPYLSLALEIPAGTVADGKTHPLSFTFGESSKRVPYGVRSLSLVVDSSGSTAGRSDQAKWRVALRQRAKRQAAQIAWYME